MMKRLRDRKLTSGFGEEEQAEPMAGLSNMSDTMLVLAVGIMLALVINWHLDLGATSTATSDTLDQSQLTEIQDYTNVNEDELTQEQTQAGLEEKGKVFVDPNTGKMYVLVENSN